MLGWTTGPLIVSDAVAVENLLRMRDRQHIGAVVVLNFEHRSSSGVLVVGRAAGAPQAWGSSSRGPHVAESAGRPSGAQRVGGVDAVAASQR